MAVNIGPKIGIDGEAEYRKQINNIIQQAKTLNSEMKAVSASFDDSTSSQEKASATAQVLTKQIENQRKRVSMLSEMLEKSTTQLGENDTKTLRWQQAVNEANAELSRMEKELQDTEKELEDFEDSSEDAGDATSFFGDMLSANMVSDFATDCLRELAQAAKEFAQQSIESAAEVKAANSQFEQSFGDLADEATEALDNIADEVGVAASRMKSSYTSIYAFAKTTGAESEDALDIASRAMEVAADSAAYYDKSIEEVTETLQSFLKGNYENDAALGISATETTRNAKANEMYATSFDKLSESQKVDVLLAMVEAGNEASGALGQAAREADSWANVTGEAEEAWKQLQAVVGDPILEAIIPVIQGITDAIYDMIEVTASEELSAHLDELDTSLASIDQRFQDTSAEIEGNARLAEVYVARLEELESAGLGTAEAQQDYADVVELLNDLIPDLNLQIDEQTGLINESKEAILGEIEAMKQKAIMEAQYEKYTEMLEEYADATLALQDANKRLEEVDGKLQIAQQNYNDALGDSASQTNALTEATQDIAGAMTLSSDDALGFAQVFTWLGEKIAGVTNKETEYGAEVTALTVEKRELNQEISEGTEKLGLLDAALLELANMCGICTEETKGAADAQNQLDTSTEEVIASMEALLQEYEEAKTSARKSIDSQIGYFDELTIKSTYSAETIVDNWAKQQQAFSNYSANLQKAVDMGLDETLVQQLADGSQESMAILDEFVNGTDLSVDEINQAFGKMSEARDSVSEAMADIQSTANEELDDMIAEAEAAGMEIPEALASGIEATADVFASAMKSLGKKGASSFSVTAYGTGSAKPSIDGSHASGLDYVPFDGYIAELHKGEMVLTQAQAEAIRAAEYIYIPQNDYTERTGGTSTVTHNYGGVTFQIYQQPGEDDEELAYRLMDLIQTKIDKEGACIGA